MEILLSLLVLALVVSFVSVPLLRRRGRAEPPGGSTIAELEARKEAKYREIRDAELDHAAGKLSDEDFRRQDAELRREAIEILGSLERASGERPAGEAEDAG